MERVLGGRGEYGVDAQLMFIGQRSMTYHETRLIQNMVESISPPQQVLAVHMIATALFQALLK